MPPFSTDLIIVFSLPFVDFIPGDRTKPNALHRPCNKVNQWFYENLWNCVFVINDNTKWKKSNSQNEKFRQYYYKDRIAFWKHD